MHIFLILIIIFINELVSGDKSFPVYLSRSLSQAPLTVVHETLLFEADCLYLPVAVFQWITPLRRLLHTSASSQIAFWALAPKRNWLCFIISFNRNSVSWRLQLSFLFVWKTQDLTAILLVFSEAGQGEGRKTLNQTRGNTLWQTFFFFFLIW